MEDRGILQDSSGTRKRGREKVYEQTIDMQEKLLNNHI